MKIAAALLLLVALGSVLSDVLASEPASPAVPPAAVAYPEGYRAWAHVKSTLIGPDHPRYEAVGGFQHFYANADAMVGYRSREFPEGSVVVLEWLGSVEAGGAFQEGTRRQVDVMVKDSRRFAATGGWGFQRFVGDSRSELAAKPTPAECFSCHERMKKDGLVLSVYRP